MAVTSAEALLEVLQDLGEEGDEGLLEDLCGNAIDLDVLLLLGILEVVVLLVEVVQEGVHAVCVRYVLHHDFLDLLGGGLQRVVVVEL